MPQGMGRLSANEERAARVALSHINGIGPARLRWLMREQTAVATLEGLRRGSAPLDDGAAPRGVRARLVAEWQAAARALDPDALLSRHLDAGLHVLIPGDDRWPFTDDPEPPSVLYVWGDPTHLRARPAVAIVGTRRCTDLGRVIANELGAELVAVGVDVVSGLALGIDGAAHAGTLGPRGGSGEPSEQGCGGVPIAVVANGLDRVSPRFHRALTERVAARGAVVSEAPLGTNGDRWRFPARNRLIAGLSDIVIVVESHAKGGALITVDEATERGVPVMAVPGSIRSPASTGSNRLLADGAAPLCAVNDVLELLGLSGASASQGQLFADDLSSAGDEQSAVEQSSDERSAVERSAVDSLSSVVLAEVATGPTSLDRLVQVSGQSLADVMVTVQRMASLGRVAQVGSTVSLLAEPRRQRR